MNPQRPIWQSALTPAERGRGWVFFALYVFLFPPLMGLIQRAMGGELPVAEANVIYYLLCVTLVLLVLWNFLKKSFFLLLDWLPENLFAFVTGLAGAGALHFLVMLLPYPVDNPSLLSYQAEFALSPKATAVILLVLMPVVEEVLFRGVLFGTVGRYSRPLAYVLSTGLYAVYCVWQFVYSFGAVDFRYLLLAAQYLPMGLALSWCYDRGGSVWSAAVLHAVINAFTLFFAIH